MSQLNGTATVTFEKKESARKAIENYNGKLKRTSMIMKRIYLSSIFQENKYLR